MGLLAQHAYGKSDKIDTGLLDQSISGVILSPKSENPESLEKFITKLKENNIEFYLDPQFYMHTFEGSIGIGKLDKYSFYPNDTVSKKFLSIPQNIHSVIKSHIDYQKQLDIETVISPNIFFESFDSRSSQIALSLANESIAYTEDKDILISLCIHESAFSNFDDVRDFLDIISLFDVSGFYIIIERNMHNNPNMINSDIMANIMYFLYNLSTINMYKVILGYSDYIGIPFYATGINSISTGWYENTKKFDRHNFEPKSGMRRANKRYFSNQILNSLLLTPEIQMIQTQEKLGKILSNTKYDYLMYNDLTGNQWTDVNSCLERWMAIKTILNKIDTKESVEEKVEFMLDYVNNAIDIYSELPEELFDAKSKSTHLKVWVEGLNKFKEILEDI